MELSCFAGHGNCPKGQYLGPPSISPVRLSGTASYRFVNFAVLENDRNRFAKSEGEALSPSPTHNPKQTLLSVTSIPLLERTDCTQKINLTKLGPEHISKIKFAVRTLPQQKT
jgi:hypothetical protein